MSGTYQIQQLDGSWNDAPSLHAAVGCRNDGTATAIRQKPLCEYCETDTGLRMVHDGGGFIAPAYTCEACFTGQDDGPSFDDLPEVKS